MKQRAALVIAVGIVCVYGAAHAQPARVPKQPARPAVKQPVRPAVKPPAKPIAKPGKPPAKPAGKPAVKPATKPAIKPPVKPTTPSPTPPLVAPPPPAPSPTQSPIAPPPSPPVAPPPAPPPPTRPAKPAAKPPAPTTPPPPIDRAQRVSYIAGALDALREARADRAGLVNTTKYVRAVERNKCRAAEQSLRVGCLIAAATQSCRTGEPAQRDRCLRVTDVIVTNRLSDPTFIPKDVRYDIMSESRDSAGELARELERRYAILVSELMMSSHFPTAASSADSAAVAGAIDGYCTEVASMRDLSWQYCVAAVAWFIGTDGGIEGIGAPSPAPGPAPGPAPSPAPSPEPAKEPTP